MATGFSDQVLRQVQLDDPRNVAVELYLQLNDIDPTTAMEKAHNDLTLKQNLYQHALREAAKFNPKLNITKSVADHEDALRDALAAKIAAEQAAQTEQFSMPQPGAQQPSEGQNFIPRTGGEVADVGVQTLRGAVIDPIAGSAKLADDLLVALNRSATLEPGFQRIGESALQFAESAVPSAARPDRAPGREVQPGEFRTGVGESVQDWAERIVGSPQTGLSQTTRALAGFLVPFIGIARNIRLATGAGPVVSGLLSDAATNFVFVDPDEPLIIDVIDRLTRGISPENPASLRGRIMRFIDGDITEEQLQSDFVSRGLRVGEGVPMGAITEGVFAVFRMLKGARAAKRGLEDFGDEAAGGAVPPDTPPPRPDAPPTDIAPAPLEGEVFPPGQAGPGVGGETVEGQFDVLPSGSPQLPAPRTRPARTPTTDVAPAPLEGEVLPPSTGGPEVLGETVEGIAEVVDEFEPAVRNALLRGPDVPLLPEVAQSQAQVMEEMEVALRPSLGAAGARRVVRAFIGATAGAGAAEAGAAEDDDRTATQKFLSTLGFAVGGAVALGAGSRLFPAIKRLQDNVIQRMNLPESIVRDVKLRPSRPRRPVDNIFVKIATESQVDEVVQPGVVTETVDISGTTQRINMRFNAIQDPEDLAKFIRDTDSLFPEADAARRSRLNTPKAEVDRLARDLLVDPDKLMKLITESQEPYAFSTRAAALRLATRAADKRLIELARAHLGGQPNGLELAHQFALAGEIRRAFDLGRSDFGRALNMFRETTEGSLHMVEFGPDGMASEVPLNISMKTLAERILAADKEGALGRMAFDATGPNGRRALFEGFVNILLGSVRTPLKALGGDVVRLTMEPLVRTTGAIATRGPGSPEVREGVVMLGSLARNSFTALKLGTRTALTGETSFVERGATLATTGIDRPPQITAEAFPRASRTPGVGPAINALGHMVRFLGGRGLLTTDEMIQFLVERMELDAMAKREAIQRGLKGDEAAQFVAERAANPSPFMVQEAKRQKRVLTFMNSLFDERGGFGVMRRMAGSLLSSVQDSPLIATQFLFLRTITNMTANALEFAPGLNLLSGDFRAMLRSPDPVLRAEARGKLITGGLLLGVGMTLGATGRTTGRLTADNDLRRQLEGMGIKENQLDLGGLGKVKIDPQEPLGFILAASATLGAVMQGVHKDSHPDVVNASTAVLMSIMDLMTDGTIIQAFADIQEAIDSQKLPRRVEARGLAETGLNTVDDMFLRSLLPPRAFQDLRKKVDAYKRVYDNFIERVASRTPGMSSRLPVSTDVFGRKRRIDGTVPGAADDPVDKALQEKGVVVRDPRRVFTRDGVSVPLKATEVQRLKDLASTIGGRSLYDDARELIETDAFKDSLVGPGSDAAIMFNEIKNERYAVARELLFNESPDLQERIRKERVKVGQRVIGP